jgi:exodeoxyribonuclease VII large subunit
MTEPAKKVFSLQQLLESLNRMIAKNYEHPYWIKAEIIKINEYKYSGHCYPEFVEKQNGKIVAQIRGIIWEKTYQAISKKFEEVTGEKLKEGMTVVCLTQISFDPIHGLSLIIKDIDPSFSLGEMMRERNAAIERLHKEGIFRKNKQLQLPILPCRIAIISVYTSKGYQDFNNVLSDYQEKYKPFTYLFPALLQGDKAVESMIQVLLKIKEHIQLFDVVLILRGGGSDIGLNAYDSYEFAATVATFPIPIITGIGHSTNETVVEMVAWKNMITPTETAYFLMSRYADFEKNFITATQTVINASRHSLANQSLLLGRQAQRMKNVFLQKTMLTQQRLENCKQQIKILTYKNIIANQKIVSYSLQTMLNRCRNMLLQTTRQLNIATQLLFQLPKMTLQHAENNLKINTIKYQSFDSNTLLNKGFSITTYKKQTVKSVTKLKKGDNIITQLSDGKITSTIKNITPNE